MTQSSLGLEFDGEQVTVVEVVGDMAVSVRSVALDNLEETVELVLAGFKIKRSDAPIRVALAAPKTLLRPVDVTPTMRTRAGFEESVYNTIRASRELTTCAGLFFNPEQVAAGTDAVSAGIVAITPNEPVAAVYNAMGTRPAEVVAAPFTITTDGLWLGLRYASADLTLVVNGRPVNYRQLQAGGLSTVIGLLGDVSDPEAGQARLQDALHRSGPGDPIAEAELDRYLRLVSAEIRQSVEFFTRSGEQVPSTIATYGPGAVAIGLDGALAEAGFTVELPEELVRALGFIPPADRAVALGAFFAATSAGIDTPQAVYLDARSAEQEGRFAFLNKRGVRIGGSIAAAVAVFAYTVVPTASAFIERNGARSDRAKAAATFEPYAAQYSAVTDYRLRKGIVATARGAELKWAEVIRMLARSAPTGVTMTQLSASTDPQSGTTVAITAERAGGSYQELTLWLTELRAQPMVLTAWASSFSNRAGKSSYQLFVQLNSDKLYRGNEETVTESELTPSVDPTTTVTSDQTTIDPSEETSSDATLTTEVTTPAPSTTPKNGGTR